MKKIKIQKRLELSKESISLLTNSNKRNLLGGVPPCSKDRPATCDKVSFGSISGTEYGPNTCTA
jgi:hypothetical protein